MRERLVREAGAVALLLGGLLAAVALASHSPLDPSLFHLSSARGVPHNLAGWLGASLSAGLLGLIGLTAFLLPLLAMLAGWRALKAEPMAHPRLTIAGWGLVVLALPGFAELACADILFRGGTLPCGGWIGRAEVDLLGALAGPVGTVVILVFLLLIGILLVSKVSLAGTIEGAAGGLRERWQRRREARDERRLEHEREAARRRMVKRQLEGLERGREDYRGPVTIKELEGRGRFRITRRVLEEPASAAAIGAAPGPEVVEAAPAPAAPAAGRRSRSAKPQPTSRLLAQEEFDFVEDLDSYDLPKVSFLDEPEAEATHDGSALLEISRTITAKCQEFKVGGEVVNIRTGPVITTYEFRLDSGVKISAVQNLAEDLALALRTESVRIERIPGRATVGIEVPNPQPAVIRLRQLLDASEFQRSPSLLTLALGVDIHGSPFLSDLQRMPHLLIGGFTGAGKSVGINAMIMSVLYKARPEEVKFILVDPKMVELGVYADIPQLLTPIINDPKKAANALGWAVAEMEGRYRRLAATGVRNLAQYNQLVKDPAQLKRLRELLERRGGDDDEAPPELEPLPYILIIIDELADLMMTSSRAVEESITRLAQKARAVGIHLICATQRPSVDILTGIIKANFPCRIAYKVRSKFDSRTILDAVGAEHLLGRGDMLYLPPGTSTVRRLHGPLVTEKEIATVVRYIKRFGKPEYQRDVLSHPPLGGDKGKRGGADLDEEELSDPMFEQAAKLVVKTRKASASFVQRRIRVGYTRAARLLDIMEQEGLVSPLDDSNSRQVLVPPDYFEEVDDTLALNGGEEDD